MDVTSDSGVFRGFFIFLIVVFCGVICRYLSRSDENIRSGIDDFLFGVLRCFEEKINMRALLPLTLPLPDYSHQALI